MSFSLASLMSYPLWTLVFAIFFPALAAIATFVCLRRANTARRLVGFFVIVAGLALTPFLEVLVKQFCQRSTILLRGNF